jgi:hypothetical protein
MAGMGRGRGREDGGDEGRGIYDEGDQSDGLELPPADAHFAPREGVLLPPEAELWGMLLAAWDAGWGVDFPVFGSLGFGGWGVREERRKSEKTWC